MIAALQILEELGREFPLPADFRGSHALYIDRDSGRLGIGIWNLGTNWPILLDPEDLDKDPVVLIQEIAQYIREGKFQK